GDVVLRERGGEFGIDAHGDELAPPARKRLDQPAAHLVLGYPDLVDVAVLELLEQGAVGQGLDGPVAGPHRLEQHQQHDRRERVPEVELLVLLDGHGERRLLQAQAYLLPGFVARDPGDMAARTTRRATPSRLP